jgi:hypothetical protein
MALATIVWQFGGHRGHGFDGCLYDVVVLMFRACGVKSAILLVVVSLILLDLVSTRQLRFPEALRFPEGVFFRRYRIT